MTKDQMTEVFVNGLSVVFSIETDNNEQFLKDLIAKRNVDLVEIEPPHDGEVAPDDDCFIVSIYGREDLVRLVLNDVGLGHTQGYVWVRTKEDDLDILRCACCETGGSLIQVDD